MEAAARGAGGLAFLRPPDELFAHREFWCLRPSGAGSMAALDGSEAELPCCDVAAADLEKPLVDVCQRAAARRQPILADLRERRVVGVADIRKRRFHGLTY